MLFNFSQNSQFNFLLSVQLSFTEDSYLIQYKSKPKVVQKATLPLWSKWQTLMYPQTQTHFQQPNYFFQPYISKNMMMSRFITVFSSALSFFIDIVVQFMPHEWDDSSSPDSFKYHPGWLGGFQLQIIICKYLQLLTLPHFIKYQGRIIGTASWQKIVRFPFNDALSN